MKNVKNSNGKTNSLFHDKTIYEKANKTDINQRQPLNYRLLPGDMHIKNVFKIPTTHQPVGPKILD